MRRLAILAILLLGCGGASDLAQQQPTPIPAPHPGANPASLQALQIRFINQSAHVSDQQWVECVAAINWQLMVDLGPRWGCNGQGAIWLGELDPAQPTVILQDRETGPGGYTDGVVGRVAYRPNTALLWPAYCSHVAINLLTPGYLAGQSVEAYDYRRPDYAESGPWQLADFDFPSAHGLGGTYYDCRGNAAYDLLHKLDYP